MRLFLWGKFKNGLHFGESDGSSEGMPMAESLIAHTKFKASQDFLRSFFCFWGYWKLELPDGITKEGVGNKVKV